MGNYREKELICREKRIKHEEALEVLYRHLQNLSDCLNPSAVLGKDALSAIHEVENEVAVFLKNIKSDANFKDRQEQVRYFYAKRYSI